MSELAKKATQEIVDGFDTFEDGTEGDEQSLGDRLIQGPLVKFTNDAIWATKAGDEIPASLELVAIDVVRLVMKWKPDKDELPDRQVLEPGQKFPDLKKLNEETPKSEWVKGPDGQLRGPWQSQHLVYLLDLKTMSKFTYTTGGTVGGAIAVHDLVDRVKMMRRFRGSNVYAEVNLSDTFMNTRFGGRQRPHFLIKKWITLGSDSQELAALPNPNDPTLKGSEAAKPEESIGKPVDTPSAKEVLDDDIPF
jgi:hypothetical protein